MRVDRRKIESLRVRAGLLRRELAAKAGVAVQTLDKACCTGRCGIVAGRKIAAALGLTFAEILLDPDVEQVAIDG